MPTGANIRLRIDGEDNTLGSALVTYLFEAGATFAACTKPHPQDRHLIVTLGAEDVRSTLLEALDGMVDDMDRMLAVVDAHTIGLAASEGDAPHDGLDAIQPSA